MSYTYEVWEGHEALYEEKTIPCGTPMGIYGSELLAVADGVRPDQSPESSRADLNSLSHSTLESSKLYLRRVLIVRHQADLLHPMQ